MAAHFPIGILKNEILSTQNTTDLSTLKPLSSKSTAFKISPKQSHSITNQDSISGEGNSIIVRDFYGNPEAHRQAQAFAIAKCVHIR